MKDLTREAVSVADDYFQPVDIVGVSDLKVRSRLISVIGSRRSE